MNTFFSSLQIFEELFLLDADETIHAIKVMRMTEGENLKVINGNGIEVIAKIISTKGKYCQLQVQSVTKKEKGRNYGLSIAISPTKNNDRFEWFLEKAIEIGVDEIIPIYCQNSERFKLNYERINKQVIAGLKQSNNYFKPEIKEAISFKKLMEFDDNYKGFIAHCKTDLKLPLNQVFTNEKMFYRILIGPEGDFTQEEIDFALKTGYQSISLGENRLRTETAGLLACMSPAIIFGT